MAQKRKSGESEQITVVDEPGMAERFQRGLRKALSTPPKHRTVPIPKPKERPASKGRVHKGKTRNQLNWCRTMRTHPWIVIIADSLAAGAKVEKNARP